MTTPRITVECRCGFKGLLVFRGCPECGAPWPEALVSHSDQPGPTPAPDKRFGPPRFADERDIEPPLDRGLSPHTVALREIGDGLDRLQEVCGRDPANPNLAYIAGALEGYGTALQHQIRAVAKLAPPAEDEEPLELTPGPGLDDEEGRFGHIEDEGRCLYCQLPEELWGAFDPSSALCPSRLLAEVQDLRERQKVPRLRMVGSEE